MGAHQPDHTLLANSINIFMSPHLFVFVALLDPFIVVMMLSKISAITSVFSKIKP